jgi:hypothetical protein
MPQRFELTELVPFTIGGIPAVMAKIRGGHGVGFAATYDGDGLLETEEDCMRMARQWQRRLDKKETHNAEEAD